MNEKGAEPDDAPPPETGDPHAGEKALLQTYAKGKAEGRRLGKLRPLNPPDRPVRRERTKTGTRERARRARQGTKGQPNEEAIRARRAEINEKRKKHLIERGIIHPAQEQEEP